MTDKIIEIMARAITKQQGGDWDWYNPKDIHRITYLECSQAALKAIQDAGYVVVPVEATQGIVTAMNKAGIDPYHVYSEAIQAAQKEE